MYSLELGLDSVWCLFGPRWSLHLENIVNCWQFVVLFLQDSYNAMFSLGLHQASSVGNEHIRVDVLYFLWHGVLTVFLSRRHVIVRTSPNHRYTFTLRTHPSVVPGSIAFSLPQVTRKWIYSPLILKVVEESIHLKQAVSPCSGIDSYWWKRSRCYIRNLKIYS